MTIVSLDPSVKARRRRRSPAEMRAQAIRSARALLEREGPQAVTLKAVASRAGVTHGNLTYHFGTVDALHAALVSAIIEDLKQAAESAVAHLRRGEVGLRVVVDVVFDAFAVGGAGRLVAWLVATGADHRLEPLYAIIAELAGDLARGEPGRRAGGTDAIGRMVVAVVIPALGSALIGDGLEKSLGLERDAARRLVAEELAGMRETSSRAVLSEERHAASNR